MVVNGINPQRLQVLIGNVHQQVEHAQTAQQRHVDAARLARSGQRRGRLAADPRPCSGLDTPARLRQQRDARFLPILGQVIPQDFEP